MVDGWQPIKTAPKDGTQFLAALTNGRVVLLHAPARPDSRYSWWQGSFPGVPIEDTHHNLSPDLIRATYWMPLPEPPNG